MKRREELTQRGISDQGESATEIRNEVGVANQEGM